MAQMTLDKTVLIEDAGSVSILRCPRCGGEYLHHMGVKVFDRGEDGPAVVRTSVTGGASKMELVLAADSQNPSSRRDGLAIQFSCEGCGGSADDLIELTIAQHKGSTEIGWRYTPAAKFL
jgi:hypothetical protein